MVLLNMLMKISLPNMGELMMMTMISPSGREVPLVESHHRSLRLVPPRFCLEMAALHPESLLLIFFHVKTHHVAEDGHRGPARWPTR